VDSKAGLSA